MGKKSNPTKNDNAKKGKKKHKSGPKAIGMKLKAPAPNPFEAIWSRRKFDILGKKHKGDELRIGLARSLAIEKRKKTLLKEYEQSAKSSVFVDKRIGEQNEELGEFDKAILRSQRERRLKLKKKSKFNLSDGEEEELDVGFSAGRDDFDDDVPFDDDEDDELNNGGKRSAMLEQLDSQGSQVTQDGLVEGQGDRQKSKKEVMEEIILKSKFFKAQKAKDKEENEELVDQLDKDFKSMVHSKALVSLTQPDKIRALKALVNMSIPKDNEKKSEVAESQRNVSLQKEKPDTYDELLSEMALDIRARASELAKTPEEIAQEEKERLERLEEERKKRMVAADESSDEDDNAYEDNDASAKKPISGDDLGDSFHDEKPRSKLGWIDEILKRENEDNSENEDDSSNEDEDSGSDEDDPEEEGTDEDDDEHGKSQTVKDWEQSDDENLDTDLEDSEDDFGEDVIKESKVGKKSKLLEAEGKEKDKIDTENSKSSLKQHSAQQVELPYTIEAPKSFEEFTSLLEKCSDDQVIEAISRIRAFNAIKVAAENRKKMQVFYGILLQYFAVLANKVPLNMKLLNALVRPLVEISAEIPYFAAICARQRLHRTRVLFCEDLKNEGKNCWPSIKTLFLLRLWSLMFPCSDFRHAVMTPATLLMCEYLTRCPITCGRDVAVGSFLCSMMLSVTKHSLKYCPEAIIFIQTLLLAALDKKQMHSKNSQLNSLLEIKGVRPLLHIQSRDTEIKALNFVTLMELPADSPYFSSDEFRASILVAIMETVEGFINIYEGFNSFPEIFMPISKLLNELVAARNHMPDALQEKMNSVIQLIETKTEENQRLRQPLRMRKQKPVPIKMVNPKFEENFIKGRDYDPDRERAEMRKLKKRVKQEAKGAAREIRKDNHFLFGVKEKEKAALAEEKSEKYGKALSFLQEQEHAFKSGQLGGNRKKRRR